MQKLSLSQNTTGTYISPPKVKDTEGSNGAFQGVIHLAVPVRTRKTNLSWDYK